jgi:two-component system OmpR family sensor kinase
MRRQIPLIIFLTGILVTCAIAFSTYRSADKEQELSFDSYVEKTQTEIQYRLGTYIAILRAGAGLFAANGSIDRNQFHAFANQLDVNVRFPGMQGIGYSARLAPYERTNIIDAMHQQAVSDFHIWPETPERTEYHTIIYLEPDNEQNRQALGYDMHSESIRRAAMDRARDMGIAQATGKVTLIQDTGSSPQPGFLVYFPVYRDDISHTTPQERTRALRGFVYAPFHIYDLLNSILGDNTYPGIEFIVYDGEGIQQNTILYTSFDPKKSIPEHPSYTDTITVKVAGRVWTMYFFSDTAFPLALSNRFIPIIVISGLFISLILFLLTRSQLRAREKAELALIQLQESEKKLRRNEERLQLLVDEKDEFISIASHELKTPLTSIKAFAQILERTFTQKGDTQSQAYLHRMNIQINRLSNLVMDLLDVTKIQAGKVSLRKEQFDINTLIDEVIADVSPATKHIIKRKGHAQVIVTADPGRIDQVLTNFLSNAIKYSPGNAEIIVHLEIRKNTVVVGVQDFGVGVPKEEVDKIFDRFYQVKKNRVRHDPSLGLGLYISSEIIARHHGKIWVESTENNGSTFYFSLPIY